MARALVTLERQSNQSNQTWKPTVVWLATKRKVEARALPGSPSRDRWVQTILDGISRPRLANDQLGTWEDWIGWALNALANGHDRWAVEVEPELTLTALYERQILSLEPQSMTAPNVRPGEVPEDLGGYRKVRPS